MCTSVYRNCTVHCLLEKSDQPEDSWHGRWDEGMKWCIFHVVNCVTALSMNNKNEQLTVCQLSLIEHSCDPQ